MKLSKSQKKELFKIIAGALLLAVALLLSKLLPLNRWVELLIFLPAFLICGGETLLDACRNIARGQVFDEHFLMSVAGVCALILGEHAEAVAVMLFAEIGEFFESYAVGNARRSVEALAELCPDTVQLWQEGAFVEVPAEKAKAGDLILVGAGSRIALDGIVEEGEATLDCSALTGESVPREVTVGSEVSSGTINLSGMLKIRASKPAAESSAARILSMVEDASSQKARTETFITRFARVYTPVVVGAALLLAVIPPLLTGFHFSQWIHRALTFLVISCPCALVISVPLTFFGTIGGSAKRGILFKDNRAIESLSKASVAAFDKTGTLTKGQFALIDICPAENLEGKDPEALKRELLTCAAAAEYSSTHPIAQALLAACSLPEDAVVNHLTELRGKGRTCTYNGAHIAAGNRKLMADEGIDLPDRADQTTVVHVAKDGVYLGSLMLADAIKQESPAAIAALRQAGVSTVMLSGDNQNGAQRVAAELSISRYKWGLLPEEKLTALDELSAEQSKNKAGGVIFVGDGINDAPALARADAGIAMGGIGSDAAIEAADVVLVNDDPRKVAEAVIISRKAMRIARENIIFALGIKLLVLILSALGITGMWLAVFADVGVSVIAILNAMRTLN